jgi:uncharacterized DUF497 family protein
LKIAFDQAKRDLTLARRGLDFARAEEVFAGLTATIADGRFDYGEARFITAGRLDGRLVVVVWTPRARSRASSTRYDGDARHIISMRYCHAKEEKVWLRRMERS